LTQTGERFLHLTSDLLERVDAVEIKLKKLRNGDIDHLRIGIGSVPAHTWISAALMSFSQAHPKCTVAVDELQWWELVPALRDGRFDMIFGECSDAERETAIKVAHLPHRPGCFVVRSGHKLAHRDDITLREICEYPNVGPRLPAARLPGLPAVSGMGRISDDGRFFMPKIECSWRAPTEWSGLNVSAS
jgi:DNA-binding transcriptional LysR family regulator